MAVKEYISYEEITENCKSIAKQLIKYKFDKIIAVTRGGMVPACLIAQFLNIKKISSIALVSYDADNCKGNIKCLVSPDIAIDENTLFVDDLYDSGNTYKYLKKKYPQSKIAIIYTKNRDAELDFAAKEKNADIWQVFPWEFDPLS
jgi:xanthine phosphoribosyltransferase